MASYQIGEVARLTGINSKTIRYYEEIGLIPPAPRRNASYASAGYRVYSESDVKRLTLIKRAKLLDLSLAQLRQLVEAADDGCCEAVEPTIHTLLESKLAETETKLQELDELRDTLRGLLSRGAGPSTRSAGVLSSSDCITTDCDSTVPVEALSRSGYSRTKAEDGESAAAGCCEPECGPSSCG